MRCFFFFQAEDGIRDYKVTGVQTCALPIASLREYTARWGITPERLRPGQKVMHPGPMNRGIELDQRVAGSADSLIEAQVRSGLVVRMAVLYDVLTGGPTGVRALAAAEVA